MKNTKLLKLRRSLPKNGVSIIAGKLGVSPSLVSMVLGGSRSNVEVINAAIELIKEDKKK